MEKREKSESGELCQNEVGCQVYASGSWISESDQELMSCQVVVVSCQKDILLVNGGCYVKWCL